MSQGLRDKSLAVADALHASATLAKLSSSPKRKTRVGGLKPNEKRQKKGKMKKNEEEKSMPKNGQNTRNSGREMHALLSDDFNRMASTIS